MGFLDGQATEVLTVREGVMWLVAAAALLKLGQIAWFGRPGRVRCGAPQGARRCTRSHGACMEHSTTWPLGASFTTVVTGVAALLFLLHLHTITTWFDVTFGHRFASLFG
jgi:hypothetical protein